MQTIGEMILRAFEELKASGSYFLFYLLALGMGLMISWNRYGNAKLMDNWMVEEAKKKIQLWPFLFGLLALLLVAANPIMVWLLNKIFPLDGRVDRLWPLLLVLFLIAYGVVCFISLLGEQKQINAVVVGLTIIIGLAGSGYGILANRQDQRVYQQQQEAEAAIADVRKSQGKGGEVRILAPASFLEYVGIYRTGLVPLYGKDLYTPGLDLGIMDAYPQEYLRIYEAVEHPERNLSFLGQTAENYGCEMVLLENFSGRPRRIGSFVLLEQTEQYLIYGRE